MKYDILITFAGGVTRVIPFGMHKEWCEEIIAEAEAAAFAEA